MALSMGGFVAPPTSERQSQRVKLGVTQTKIMYSVCNKTKLPPQHPMEVVSRLSFSVVVGLGLEEEITLGEDYAGLTILDQKRLAMSWPTVDPTPVSPPPNIVLSSTFRA